MIFFKEGTQTILFDMDKDTGPKLTVTVKDSTVVEPEQPGGPTGETYDPLGDELIDMLTGDFTAVASPQKLVIDGKIIDVAAYNIGGYNYFRLRDLAILLDFAVDYNAGNGKITLDLKKPYTE